MNRKQLFGLLALLLVLPPLAMQAQRLTGYEYWFDGKVDDRVSRSLSGYEAEIETDIATQHLSSGLHTLHMRFKQSDGEYGYSPVTSQIFFKHNAEEGGIVEYWFDDDIKNSATVPLPSEATENMIDVALDMTDSNKFPIGFHRLNIRVSTEGKSLSNIYTAHVLKVPSGNLDIIEYWVDDDFENRQTIEGKVASTDENAYVFNDFLNLSAVPSGPHRIYYRPTNKNGTASGAVSMSSVVVGGGTPSKIEYWFDGDVANSAAVELPASAMNDTIDVALVMNNSEKFPLGMHQLSMRMITKDREQSPVYSARVLKKASGNIDVIEYWVDDNYKEGKNRTVTGNVASNDENAFVFANSFDLSDVPAGLHRVYYRATNAKGNANSAVSMTTVTVGGGNINKLEYWFDGNSDKRYTVSGSVDGSNKECYFDKALNLSDVSEGIHRMYYRGINGSGATRSAVSMTPVVVKSKYNVEDRDALTVTEQAYWFDNEDPEIRMVSDPKNIKDLPITLDARKLKDGKHTLHLQYGNSAGIWNAPIDFSFTKTKVDNPMIVANANVEDGVVTIKFSSVPWGQVYTVVRKYPSGTERRVENIWSLEYPAALKSTDKPGLGTYTYYIKGKYIDADGNKQEVLSGDMNITVDEVAKSVERGTIDGVITFEGKEATNEYYYDYTIHVKGIPEGYSDYRIRWLKYGHFTIEDVPYGTELTIGIEHKNDLYYFKDQTLIVNETTINNTYCFDGTKDENYDDLPNNDASDLVLTDKIHITPNGWEIPLFNHSKKTWSGNLIVRVISKKIKDKLGKDYSDESKSALDYLYYNSNICYSTIADMPVNIQGYNKGEQIVMLDITNMPYADKNEDYYVYLYSKKKDSEEMKIVEGSEYNLNPQVLNFNPSDYSGISIMNECVEVMKWMKEFADWGDPFKLAWKSSERAWNNFLETYELELRKNDPDKKLIEDGFDAYLKSAGLMMNCFHGELTQGITKNIKKDPLYNATDKITDLYKSIKDVSDAGVGHEANSEAADGHRFFALAKQVLKYADEGDPVVSIYKTYFEVGKKMIDAIENMTFGIHDHAIWEKIHSGQGVYKIKIRKYTDPNEGIRYFSGRDFCGKDLVPSLNNITHDGQIKSISIQLIDPSNNNIPSNDLSEKNFDLMDDGIVIKDIDFPPHEGMGYEDVEAWMTIVWRNNRVTHVPLLNTDFAKIENTNSVESDKPLTMTVEFQSGSYLHTEGIPNHLTIVNPNKSWLEYIFDYLPL